MPRVFLKENVLEAARARISRLFDEFPQVLVSFSGGKDSTVVLNLALEEARRRKRLPLPVLWLDQEAEWECVVDYARSVFASPEVQPYWFQGPFKLFNATTTGADPWLHCWEPGREWVRPKEANSIHYNPVKTDRFHKLFRDLTMHWFGQQPLAQLGGVRCEESPARMNGLTCYATYKDITWGSAGDYKARHFTFYPIYDWSYSDVWKAIHEHGWRYCTLYDKMYQYGIQVRDMRVSNLHHETAVKNLRFVQEVEPATWGRITSRISSLNAVKHVLEGYSVPERLPAMFTSWREYRDHLLANLITEQDIRDKFTKQFAAWDRLYKIEDPRVDEDVVKLGISVILVNDYEGTKYQTWSVTHARDARNHMKKKGDLGVRR